MNFLKITFIILFLLSTLITVKIRPEIHQPMLIEDADFKLTRIIGGFAVCYFLGSRILSVGIYVIPLPYVLIFGFLWQE